MNNIEIRIGARKAAALAGLCFSALCADSATVSIDRAAAP